MIYEIYTSQYIHLHPSIEISVSKCRFLSLSVCLPACLSDWLTDWLNEGPKGQSKEEIIREPTTIEPQLKILKNKKLPADLTPKNLTPGTLSRIMYINLPTSRVTNFVPKYIPMSLNWPYTPILRQGNWKVMKNARAEMKHARTTNFNLKQ